MGARISDVPEYFFNLLCFSIFLSTFGIILSFQSSTSGHFFDNPVSLFGLVLMASSITGLIRSFCRLNSFIHANIYVLCVFMVLFFFYTVAGDPLSCNAYLGEYPHDGNIKNWNKIGSLIEEDETNLENYSLVKLLGWDYNLEYVITTKWIHERIGWRNKVMRVVCYEFKYCNSGSIEQFDF